MKNAVAMQFSDTIKTEGRDLLKPYSGLYPYPDMVCAGSGFVPGDGLLRGHVLMQWTVVAIAIGVGLTGRGSPPPLFPPYRDQPTTPPRPASGLLPRPKGGGSHGDIRWKAVP